MSDVEWKTEQTETFSGWDAEEDASYDFDTPAETEAEVGTDVPTANEPEAEETTQETTQAEAQWDYNWTDPTDVSEEEAPKARNLIEERVAEARQRLEALKDQPPSYAVSRQADKLRAFIREGETRSKWLGVQGEGLSEEVEAATLVYEAKLREAETWPTDSAHRRVLEQEAQQAYVASKAAQGEIDTREMAGQFHTFLAAERQKKAEEAAAAEVRAEWRQKYEELYAASGFTANPNFRTKERDDPSIPPPYLLEEARWKMENLKPSEERIAEHRAKIAKEQQKTYGWLDPAWFEV